jgi:hypothetical protein
MYYILSINITDTELLKMFDVEIDQWKIVLENM